MTAMPPAAPPPPEMSRPLPLEALSGGPVVRRITASPHEQAALARRFALLAIESLSAELTISRPRHDGPVAVRGRLYAEIVQRCVATLEPVPEHIDEAFEVFFSDEPQPTEYEAESYDPYAGDVEPLPSGPLDLGEVVAQQLGLAMDPWPRHHDAPEPSADSSGRQRPLADLKAALARRQAKGARDRG